MIVEQGSEYGITVVIKNKDGSRKDLTGYTGRAQIRRKASSPTVEGEFTVEFVDPRTSGEVRLSLPASVTSPIKVGDTVQATNSQFVYDFEVYDASSKPLRVLNGKLSMSPEVTRI